MDRFSCRIPPNGVQQATYEDDCSILRLATCSVLTISLTFPPFSLVGLCPTHSTRTQRTISYIRSLNMTCKTPRSNILDEQKTSNPYDEQNQVCRPHYSREVKFTFERDGDHPVGVVVVVFVALPERRCGEVVLQGRL